jgi:hypothetical protein
MAIVVHHENIDYSRLDRAVSEWRALAQLIASPDTEPMFRAEYEEQLTCVRAELNAALVDLDQQRKFEIERWAAPQGLRINWEQWERRS